MANATRAVPGTAAMASAGVVGAGLRSGAPSLLAQVTTLRNASFNLRGW